MRVDSRVLWSRGPGVCMYVHDVAGRVLWREGRACRLMMGYLYTVWDTNNAKTRCVRALRCAGMGSSQWVYTVHQNVDILSVALCCLGITCI